MKDILNRKLTNSSPTEQSSEGVFLAASNKTAPAKKGRPRKVTEETVASEPIQVEKKETIQDEVVKEEPTIVEAETPTIDEEKTVVVNEDVPVVKEEPKQEEPKADEPVEVKVENKPKRTLNRYDFYGVSWNGVEYDL